MKLLVSLESQEPLHTVVHKAASQPPLTKAHKEKPLTFNVNRKWMSEDLLDLDPGVWLTYTLMINTHIHIQSDWSLLTSKEQTYPKYSQRSCHLCEGFKDTETHSLSQWDARKCGWISSYPASLTCLTVSHLRSHTETTVMCLVSGANSHTLTPHVHFLMQ